MANPLDEIRMSLNTGIKSLPQIPGIKATLPELPALPGIESMSMPALPVLPMAAAGTNPLMDLLPKLPGAAGTKNMLALPGMPSTYTESVAAAKKQESLMSVNRSPPSSGLPHGEYVF